MNSHEEVTTAIVLTLTPTHTNIITVRNRKEYISPVHKPAQEVLRLEDLNLTHDASDDSIRQALEDATEKRVIGFVLIQGGCKIAEWAAGEVGGEHVDSLYAHDGAGSDPSSVLGAEGARAVFGLDGRN